jgi:hypothetical protein
LRPDPARRTSGTFPVPAHRVYHEVSAPQTPVKRGTEMRRILAVVGTTAVAGFVLALAAPAAQAAVPTLAAGASQVANVYHDMAVVVDSYHDMAIGTASYHDLAIGIDIFHDM